MNAFVCSTLLYCLEPVANHHLKDTVGHWTGFLNFVLYFWSFLSNSNSLCLIWKDHTLRLWNDSFPSNFFGFRNYKHNKTIWIILKVHFVSIVLKKKQSLLSWWEIDLMRPKLSPILETLIMNLIIIDIALPIWSFQQINNNFA